MLVSSAMSLVIVFCSGWKLKVMCGVMQIESMCVGLQDAWQDLQDRSHKHLSLKAQQYIVWARDLEIWLSEMNDVLSSTDYGRDRDAASKLLTKHKVCCACRALNCIVWLVINMV